MGEDGRVSTLARTGTQWRPVLVDGRQNASLTPLLVFELRLASTKVTVGVTGPDPMESWCEGLDVVLDTLFAPRNGSGPRTRHVPGAPIAVVAEALFDIPAGDVWGLASASGARPLIFRRKRRLCQLLAGLGAVPVHIGEGPVAVG